MPAQRRILTELAEKNGWDAVWYDEGGVSAETIDGRPVFQRLLADAAAGRIDMVAVAEMERLCRASDLRDWATISATFRKAGVLVSTPERIFNLDAAEDDFEADLRGILSKREKRKLLERTARGLREAKDAGRFAGGTPPTGYKYDPATKKLVPDPEKVPLVKRVFESSLTAWKLYKELRSEGISLNYATIPRMRTNPAYLGLRKNSKGELIQADWPAIISQELWDKQQLRQRRLPRRSARAPGSAYLLSGIVRCMKCGGPVIGRPMKPSKAGTPLHVYKCYQRSECPGGQLPGWLVDMLVVDALNQHAGDPARLKRRMIEALDLSQEDNLAERRQALKTRTLDLEERKAKLLDAVERGLLSDKIVQERMAEIQDEQHSLKEELEALYAAETIPSIPDFQAILDLAKDLDQGSRNTQRELLERLATSVEIDPRERIQVVKWRLGGESRYQVPRFKGGPGRDVERFMEVTKKRLEDSAFTMD